MDGGDPNQEIKLGKTLYHSQILKKNLIPAYPNAFLIIYRFETCSKWLKTHSIIVFALYHRLESTSNIVFNFGEILDFRKSLISDTEANRSRRAHPTVLSICNNQSSHEKYEMSISIIWGFGTCNCTKIAKLNLEKWKIKKRVTSKSC